MFTAKVRADGRFFMGYIELPGYKNTNALEQGRRYQGILFDNMPTETHWVDFTEAAFAEFSSEDLEELDGDFRLFRY